MLPGVTMYFPAGIPLVALVAFIAWSIKQETDRSRNGGASPSSSKS
jgi:hypothetical protein